MRTELRRGATLALGLGLLLLAAPVLGDHHEGGQSDNALIDMEKAGWEAWKNADGEFFEANMAEDGVIIPGTGEIQNKAAAVEGIGSGSCEVAGYDLSDFKVHSASADVKVLIYHAKQDAVCDGVKIPEKLVVSSTYVQRDGAWLPFLYQETVRIDMTP